MFRCAVVVFCALAAAALALVTGSSLFPPALGAQVLAWSACPHLTDARCAMLPVPIDPRKPQGAKLELRIARLPVTDAAQKRGTLVFIPGGPGIGIEPTLAAAAAQVKAFRRHYDVVTFDPRGIGESDPIRCDPKAVPAAPTPSADPPTRAQFQNI